MTVEEMLESKGAFEPNIEKAIDGIKAQSKRDNDKIERWRKEYGGNHAVLWDTTRAPFRSGSNGKWVFPAKLTAEFQPYIVEMAVAFLFGKPVKINYNNNDEYQNEINIINNIWRENKLDYINRKIARTVSSETEAAELWYPVRDIDGNIKIRVMLLTLDNESFYPFFNEYGDLIAFMRLFKRKNAEGNDVQMFEIYTAQYCYKGISDTSGWHLTDTKKGICDKIPVIYYKQNRPEWDSVQRLIDRYEMRTSRHADTNDYFGDPIAKAKGDVESMPEKDRDGKIITCKPIHTAEGTIWSDVEYLTWDESPESTKQEVDRLRRDIFSLSFTPDLSFENVKGINSVSGLALRLMLMCAMIKRDTRVELYGEMITRRVNLLANIQAKLSTNDNNKARFKELQVESVEFGNIIPQDLKEIMDGLSVSRAGEAVISRETAVKHHPYVDDVTEELERLDSEDERENELVGSFNI